MTAADQLLAQARDLRAQARRLVLKARKLRGKCSYCGAAKADPGKRTCEKCRNERLNLKLAAARKAVKVGLCYRCHKKPIAPHSSSRCFECLAYVAKKVRESQARSRS